MSASDTFENELLQLIYNNVAIASIGDASGLQPSAAAGSLYVSLHIADPGEGGNQGTNEADYAGYARVAVARTTGGWTVVGNAVSNAAEVKWPVSTGAGSNITHFGVGTDATGAGKLLFHNALTATVLVAGANVEPTSNAGQITNTVD